MRVCALLGLASTILIAESVAGLSWTAPAGWKTERPANSMRAATYSMAPAAGDRDPAECVVYFFGPGQGGSVEANMDRWKDQVRGPGGKPAEAKIARRTIHGLTVTTIDTSGDYNGMNGPMTPRPMLKPGYRLMGAIVEGPQGNVFLKFSGPAATVGANARRFEQLLESFHRQ